VNSGRGRHVFFGMYSLVVRWPGVASVVAWAAMLAAALAFVGARGNARTHAWLTALVVVLVLGGVLAAWYLAYRRLPGGGPPEGVVRLLYGVVLGVFVVVGLLVVAGAALFTLWTAYAAAVAQVSWYAGYLRGMRRIST
jgi:peptidoglycan/LPS O-acetylase OafA/YrhL